MEIETSNEGVHRILLRTMRLIMVPQFLLVFTITATDQTQLLKILTTPNYKTFLFILNNQVNIYYVIDGTSQCLFSQYSVYCKYTQFKVYKTITNHLLTLLEDSLCFLLFKGNCLSVISSSPRIHFSISETNIMI